MIEARIWIGCHATYNDGYLFDKQYTVTDLEELNEVTEKAEKHFLECIKKERPDWEKEGYITDTYCEELYLADYEVYINDTFVNVDFGESIYDLGKFLENLEGFSPSHDVALLIQVAKSRGISWNDLPDLDDKLFCFEVDSKSNEDVSYAYLEMTGGLDQYEGAEFLKNYFDHESHGRDLLMEFTVFEVDGTYYAVSDQD